MKKVTSICVLVSCMVLLNGCFPNPFGGISLPKTEKALKKKSKKIRKEVKPPQKPFALIQGQADILRMAQHDIEEAKVATEKPHITILLNGANKKIGIVISSIGASPRDVSNMTPKEIQKFLNKQIKGDIKYKKKLFEHIQFLLSYNVTLEEEIKKKTSIITKMKWLLIVLGIVSVLVAAFVPGGMLFVKRFWKGGFKVLKMFGEESYEALGGAVKGINKAMNENKAFDNKMEGSDRTYRQALEDSIKMESKNTKIYEEIKMGKNHLLEVVGSISKHMKKVT